MEFQSSAFAVCKEDHEQKKRYQRSKKTHMETNIEVIQVLHKIRKTNMLSKVMIRIRLYFFLSQVCGRFRTLPKERCWPVWLRFGVLDSSTKKMTNGKL